MTHTHTGMQLAKLILLLLIARETKATVSVENNTPLPSIPGQYYGLNWSTVTGEIVFVDDYPFLPFNITDKIVVISRENRPSDPDNRVRQAIMMNDIRHKFPLKAAGYDEWQNYGTVKEPAVIPVCELLYSDWLTLVAQIKKANETNNFTGVTITMTSEGVNLWDITYGPGPVRAVDWIIALMYLAGIVWSIYKLVLTTKVRGRNINVAQVSYILMALQAVVMIVYCTGRALVAEFNSFLEAALQLIFQQLVFTCLVIIASYWTEMMGAVLPKNYLTKKVQTVVAALTFTLLTIMIILTILIPFAYKSLPTTIIAIGPAEYFIIAIWYNIAGFKLIFQLKVGNDDASDRSSSAGKSRLVKVIFTVCSVTAGLIISLTGTLLYLSYSPIPFFVGAILSRIGQLITFFGVVHAFKIPGVGTATAGTRSGSQKSKSANSRSQDPQPMTPHATGQTAAE